jgi:tRNA pseudouridine55 synthase
MPIVMMTLATNRAVAPRPTHPLANDAVLVIDKPIGPTSFDVVRKIRRAAGLRRVGHGGTLDPAASGVLPICLGEATKVSQFLLDADKEYEFAVCFGVETDTDDAAGAVTVRHDAGAIEAAAVREALEPFRGAIAQVPPSYSALKRAGRPLYDYARAGETIAIGPRNVVVHELEMTAFDGPAAASFRMRCSKGTYVRAVARDLGRALGVGAHVTALRRTRSGPFSLAEARPLDDVLAALTDPEADPAALPLVEPAAALRHLEQRVITDALARDVRMGRKIALETGELAPDRRLCLLDGRGKLVAVTQPRPDRTLELLRVFLSQADSC